jgi:hypothetical protein
MPKIKRVAHAAGASTLAMVTIVSGLSIGPAAVAAPERTASTNANVTVTTTPRDSWNSSAPDGWTKAAKESDSNGNWSCSVGTQLGVITARQHGWDPKAGQKPSHDSDENGPTFYGCGIVKVDGKNAVIDKTRESQRIRPVLGVKFECPTIDGHDSFMIARQHKGDSESDEPGQGTMYTCATLKAGNTYIKAATQSWTQNISESGKHDLPPTDFGVKPKELGDRSAPNRFSRYDAPANTVFTGQYHLGDENGPTRYRTATLTTEGDTVGNALQHVHQGAVAVPAKGNGAAAVPIVTRATHDFSNPSATVSITAPAGTAFETGQTTIPGEWSANGSSWIAYGGHSLTNVKYSDSSRTITASWNGALTLRNGEYNRWLPRVVAESATAGGSTLRYSVDGRASNNSVPISASGYYELQWTAPPVAQNALQHVSGPAVSVPAKGNGAASVPIVTRATHDFSNPDAVVTLTAPAGSAFQAGQGAIPGAWSSNGTTWTSYTGHALSNAQYSNGNRTITARWNGAMTLRNGEYNRWLPRVVSDSTSAGTGTLGYDVNGTASQGASKLQVAGSYELKWQAPSQNTAPSAPRDFKYTRSAADDVTIEWKAPTSNGGAPILDYNVKVDGVDKGSRNALTRDLGKLDVSKDHRIEIRARNSAGTSPALEGTVESAFAAPTITSLRQLGSSTSVQIDWNFPNAALVKSFDVWRNGEQIAKGLHPSSTTGIYHDHDFGKSYEYKVTAHGTDGQERTSAPKSVEIREVGTIAPRDFGPTTLDRSAPVGFRFGYAVNEEVKGIDGTWLLRAPAGTRWADGPGDIEMQGWIRDSGSDAWHTFDEISMKGSVNDDRIMLRADYTVAATVGADKEISWSTPLAVDEGAPAGILSVDARGGATPVGGPLFNVNGKPEVIIPDESSVPAPVAPVIAALAQVGESRDVRIDWTADLTNVETFEVLRDGEVVKTGIPATETSAVIGGHEYGPKYEYTVTAVGKGGSKTSEAESITLTRVALEADDLPEIELDRDRSTAVRMGIAAKGDSKVTEFDGEFVMTAPKGTKFTVGQDTVRGAWFDNASKKWVESESLTIHDVSISKDGTTLTGASAFAKPVDQAADRWSWTPEVTVMPDTAAGHDKLTWSLAAQTNYGEQMVDGSTSVSLGASNVAPEAPDEVWAEQSAQNDVQVKWVEASDEDGEVVEYRVEEFLDGQKLQDAVVGADEIDEYDEFGHVFEGNHTLGKTYEYKVWSVDNDGLESENAAETALLIVDIVKPTFPVDATVRGEKITPNGFDAVWPSASDNVEVKSYRLRLNGGSWTTVAHVPGATEQRSAVTGLEPNQLYKVEVQALDARSNPSQVISGEITTAGQPTIPGVPSDVQVAFLNNETPAKWQISWQANGAENATGWELRVRNTVNNNPGSETIKQWTARNDGSLKNSDLIDGEPLKRGTAYAVDVRAVYEGGATGWSTHRVFTTGDK